MEENTLEVSGNLADHPQEIDGHRITGFLGRGGAGWVYQAAHRDTQEQVALKLLRSLAGLSSLDRLRFEREFKVASELAHPGLVGVHTYGFYQGQPYYTMELVSGLNFLQYYQNLPQPERLAGLGEVGRRLLEALEYIHAQGIIHRDLKPANVLVEAGGTARLLDFGLARGRNYSAQLTDPGIVIGTVHYMAPEQLTGGELDARTDLYGFGVLIYECLTGRVPYDSPDIVHVIYQILHHQTPSLSELAGPLPPELEALVERLLSKQPSQRFASASQVLQHWDAVFEPNSERQTEARSQVAPPELPETLFSPRFVGRAREMARLNEHYQHLKSGQGGFVSLEGVSGVGKSRLLQESTGQGRALGFPMTWGHAHENDAFPYQHWIRSLRWAVSSGWNANVEPFRRALSILLPELVEEGKAERDRSDPLQKFHLFEGMLRLLRGASAQGAVILLDDLQWADAASLEFLCYLVRTIETEEGEASPQILLLASVNTENLEADSPLSKTLGMLGRLRCVRRIPLESLTLEHSTAMICSMLGSELVEPETAQRLFEETQGNPMFVTEILKVLVAEGRLKYEGLWCLPTAPSRSAVPVTVREAVQRRLAGISPEDLQVAHLGALVGRIFPFDLIQKASGLAGDELLERLTSLTRRNILHEMPGQDSYAFDNQPIVEVLQESLALPQRRELHLRLARALEQSPDATRLAADMASHYTMGGEPELAAQHLIRAAEAHTQAFAYLEAARFYREALKLSERSPADRIALQELLADVTFEAGLSEEALEIYTALLAIVPAEGQPRVRLLRKLGICWERLGNYPRAHQCLITALQLVGIRLSGKGWKDRAGLLVRTLGFQFPSWLAGPYREDRAKTEEIHHLLMRLIYVLLALMPPGWRQHMLEAAARMQAIAAALGDVEGSSQARLLVGYIWMNLKYHKLARKSLRVAIARGRQAKSPRFRAAILRDAAFLIFLGGDALLAIETMKEAIDLAEATGSVHLIPQARCILAAIYRSRGQLHLSEEQALRAHDAAELTMSKADQSMCHANLAQARVIQGRTKQARQHLEQAEKYRGGNPMPMQELLASVAQAGVEYGEGNLEEAVASSRAARRLTRDLPALTYYYMETLTMEAASLAELAKNDSGRRDEAQAAAERLSREASGLFPGLVAVGRRLQAQLRLSAGDPEGACKILDDDLRALESVDNPLEQGLAHQVYAQALKVLDPVKSEKHQRRAREYLVSIGAKPFVERFEKSVEA